MPYGNEHTGLWHGFPPPQRLFSNRAFVGVALDPPDFEPGSWIGAGKALVDSDMKKFLLTARPRKVEDRARGYAAEVYLSDDGLSFERVASLEKEEVARKAGLSLHSIEGTSLLKEPFSGRWHLYVSADTGEEFVWGGLFWETLLLTAEDIRGPWHSEGIVLANDKPYDSHQARDASIDIVDGRWLCLYKAKDAERRERPALALSRDGRQWRKKGPLTIDGTDEIAFLSGSFFSTSSGPLFMGIQTQLNDSREEFSDVVYADNHKIGHGGGSTPHFVALLLDVAGMNLETVFRAPWTPLSSYENESHPLLGYSSTVYDTSQYRFLIYLEAIDGQHTRSIGLNETVERVIVYEMKA
jgi:hypothetical protein